MVTCSINKLVIFHIIGKNFGAPDKTLVFQEIIDTFKTKKIVLSQENLNNFYKNYEKYSEYIYSNLEKINNKLITNKKETHFSKQMIESLINFYLPFPIQDLEKYIATYCISCKKLFQFKLLINILELFE